MIEAIIGGIVAVVIAILSAIIHGKNDKIKELKAHNQSLENQTKIDKIAHEKMEEADAKIKKIQKTDKDTDELIDLFNSGGKL